MMDESNKDKDFKMPENHIEALRLKALEGSITAIQTLIKWEEEERIREYKRMLLEGEV